MEHQRVIAPVVPFHFHFSQSFLLAVGAIVSGKSGVVLYATAAISLVMIWAIWFPVVRSRHLIVDYTSSA